LGTSVVSGAYSGRFITDRAFRTLYGGAPDSYLLETALMGGGYTTAWFLDKFAPSTGQDRRQLLEHYDQAAAQIPAGCEGLMLVPYWNSVLGPYWDASASGIVVGWRGIHTPAHFYRAILEGIAFEQRLNTQGVESASGQPIERFIAVGGGSRSALWRQIIADITGKAIYRASTSEAAALGAGILAASAAGLFPDARQAARSMTHLLPDPTFPDPARHAYYSRLYEDAYIHLYPALQPYLAKI
jgi:sugar (pentulose or hexulose) kinase